MSPLNQLVVGLSKMKALPNWVWWKLETINGKETKPPFIVGSNQHASATDPSTWSKYGVAKASVALNGKQGMGFMFGNSGLGALDVDGCRNPETEEIAPWAEEFLESIPPEAHVEISPSGRGVKVFVEGELPPGERVFHLDPSIGFGGKVQIEFLGKGRYSTVTENALYEELGDVVPCNLTVLWRKADALRKKYPAVSKKNEKFGDASASFSTEIQRTADAPVTSKYALLKNGTLTGDKPCTISDGLGNSLTYPDRSGADIAFCNVAAIEHKGNADLIWEDYKLSAVFQLKWGKREASFRSLTIANALKFYEKIKPATPAQATSVPATVEAEPVEILEIDDVLEFPDMPEDAIPSSVLGDICREHFKNFPLAYAWPSLLTVAGTMVPPPGREHQEVLAESAGVGSQTNLYTALVGPVGSGKTQSIEYAIANLGLPRTKHQPIKSGSMEGLLKKLAKDGGSTPLGTAQYLVDLDEWSFFFKKAGIENSSYVDHLNSAFNKPEFRLTIAKGEEIYLNAALSFIGGIVDDRFQNCFGDESIGGFHDRFLFGLCPTQNPFVYYPFDFAESARSNASFGTMSPAPVEIDKSVWRLVQEWKRDDPALGRSVEVTVRCCSIIASFDGRSRIVAKDLEVMRPFLDYQIRCRKMLDPNPGATIDAKMSNTILQWLKRHADEGQWVNQRSLKISIRRVLENLGPKAYNDALKNLIFVHAVQTKVQVNEGARSSYLIRLAKGL